MNNEEQIQKLEKKIADLRKIYANEIHESWTQGHQTQMMIDQYSEQLNRIKEQGRQSKQSNQTKQSKTYTLIDKEGDKKQFKVVNINPDPSKGSISRESPLGQQLSKAKPGDNIQIGDQIFLLKYL